MKELGYKDLNDFASVDAARELVMANLTLVHMQFCARVMNKVAERISECGTVISVENNDYRIRPSHFIIIDFEQKMKEKGYEISIETKGSAGQETIKWFGVNWRLETKKEG